jgi:hypothetical protein
MDEEPSIISQLKKKDFWRFSFKKLTERDLGKTIVREKKTKLVQKSSDSI